MVECECQTIKWREAVFFLEVLFHPGSAAAPYRKEGRREKGYLAVADLRHGPGRIGILAASPNRATPVARIARVKSDEVRAIAGALPGIRPVDLEVRGQQRQGIPDPPLQARREERAASLVHPLGDAPSVLEREILSPDISDPQLDVRVADCSMKDVFLSFAGRRPAGSGCHRAIAALSHGDPLIVSRADSQWKILDRDGCQVGRMSKRWAPPHGMAIANARVQGIFARQGDEEEDERYRRKLRSRAWEVVVPQLLLSRAPFRGTNGPRNASAA